jgi:hypothetical protein
MAIVQPHRLTGVSRQSPDCRPRTRRTLDPSTLETTEHPTFAGLTIEHRGGFKLDIYSTSSDPSDISSAIQQQGLAPYSAVHKVDQSLAELRSIAAKMSADPALSGADIFVSIPSNTVYAEIRYPISQASQRVKAWAKLRGISIKSVQALARPSVYAGNSLNNLDGSAACTAGYTVVNTSSGNDGITTAGHCANSLKVYYGPDLNFKDQMYAASWDVQWHSHPSEPFPPYARDATAEPGTPYYRIISDKKPRSGQNIGDFLCKIW